MKPDGYIAAIEALWKANSKNAAQAAQQSLKAYPLPPIMANLEILSHGQFSRLLADTQKRAFYLGALAALTALGEEYQKVIQ